MSTVQYLRQFVNERLTAATEEILGVFAKTLVEYEEEIDRQRRLLDIVWKPRVQLHRIGLQQRHVFKEEEVPPDQQLFEQSSTLDQEEPDSPQIREENPDPPQIKEENPDPSRVKEELCANKEEALQGLKQEIDALALIPICEGSCDRKDQIMLTSRGENGTLAEKEPDFKMSPKSLEGAGPNRVGQLFFRSSPVDGRQGHKGAGHGDCGSNGNAVKRPRWRMSEAIDSDHNVHNSTMLKTKGITGKGERSLKCDTCGKHFRLLAKLRRHVRAHEGKKADRSEVREERFGNVPQLKRHEDVHADEKPYPCSTCEERFSHLSALKIHMRVHTGETPYSCKTCGKDFKYNCELKIHMRRHTGEKLYYVKN